jgi:hypothetical protein
MKKTILFLYLFIFLFTGLFFINNKVSGQALECDITENFFMRFTFSYPHNPRFVCTSYPYLPVAGFLTVTACGNNPDTIEWVGFYLVPAAPDSVILDPDTGIPTNPGTLSLGSVPVNIDIGGNNTAVANFKTGYVLGGLIPGQDYTFFATTGWMSFYTKDGSACWIDRATYSTALIYQDCECPKTASQDSGWSEALGICINTERPNAPQNVQCPAEYTSEKGICIKTTYPNDNQTVSCPTGYTSEKGICIKTTYPNDNQTVSCPTGYTSEKGICIKATYPNENQNVSCPTGYASLYGICILIANPIASDPRAVDLSASPEYCIPGIGVESFTWTYTNVPSVRMETQFDFQVDDNSNFSSPEINRLAVPASFAPGSSNGQTAYIRGVSQGDDLLFNKTYYWRVRVHDDNGNNSGWVYPPTPSGQTPTAAPGTPFTTSAHAWPAPNFTFEPPNALIKTPVSFTDQSTCYDASNAPYACKSVPANKNYTWNFGDNTPVDHTIGNPPDHEYSVGGSKTVVLTVQDNVGSCSYSAVVPIKGPLNVPEWREVSPFR